ncbi:chymotrypsin B-like [Lineus longissimus]|uniref:chymotrypsin B-like n=1 Tax=Lineus longissimus TaxID=88925 RepID=UPI002B4E2D54
MFALILRVAACLTVVKVGANPLKSHLGTWRIVGGRDVVRGQFPYMVALMESGDQICGGSLIDDNTVLTAAHCFKFHPKPDTWSVVLGGEPSLYKSDMKNDTQILKVKDIRLHPGYDPHHMGRDDIAILKLAGRATMSDKIAPIRLPSKDDRAAPETECIAIGYGNTDAYGMNGYILLFTMLRTREKTVCTKAYPNSSIYAENACAGGYAGRSTCGGDSGGPLVCPRGNLLVLEGVTSWNTEMCGTVGKPAIFTAVASYREWIELNRH